MSKIEELQTKTTPASIATTESRDDSSEDSCAAGGVFRDTTEAESISPFSLCPSNQNQQPLEDEGMSPNKR